MESSTLNTLAGLIPDMSLKDRIQELVNAGYKKSQLARAAGKSASAVTHWLNGETAEIKADSAAGLQALTGFNAVWISTGKGPKRVANVVNVGPATIGVRRVPLISYIQAGHWSEVVDNFSVGDADEWLMTDSELSGLACALEIKGESMLPEFSPGDRVIIDPDVAPQPGDFVAAKNGHEEATFKKYRPRSTDTSGNVIFELVPLNEDFPAMRSDVTSIRIVVTMVEHRKYRRRG